MSTGIGIRREDKSVWERRVPLIPSHVAEMVKRGVRVVVQPSENRVFEDEAYRAVGATVDEDLSGCAVVFGVKEMPASFFRAGQAYMFFSHTIKGQRENMAMLSDLMDKRCHLIDYERVVDNGGRRLIFFGWYAGVAGMVESLVALGRRLSTEGIDTPFARLEQPYRYDSIDDMKAVVREVGDAIRKEGLPERVAPMVVGVTGYGNVSRGAQAILDLLPTREISPAEVAKVERGTRGARNIVFKAVYQERDLVRPRDAEATFELQHYYDHPEAYVGVFEDHLPHMTMLVNCMYWDARYPRLVTKKFLRDRWADSRLTVVGDIGCDIDGAVEVTHKATEPGAPCYVYEPATDRFADGVSGNGPVIMAVDILPTEMPRESSHHFSQVLTPFAEAIATTDYGAPYDALALPAEIKRALIVHAGRLTPDYAYLSEFLR